MSAVEHPPLWPHADKSPRTHGLHSGPVNPVPEPRGYDPLEILDQAASIIRERGPTYGDIEQGFARAAQIASLKLDKEITARDVVVIAESMKDARLAVTYGHPDSLVDRINYAAFRASFELKGALK